MSAIIEDDAMIGAWHHLCVGVMLHAVRRVAESRSLWVGKLCQKENGGVDKEVSYQREVARRWIEGGIGLITYEDCCDALGVDPARAREKILDYAHRMRRVRPREE